MRLGFLLLRKSGRRGSLKFIITMLAVALGVLMLLSVFTVANGFVNSYDKAKWSQGWDKFSQYEDGKLKLSELAQQKNLIIADQHGEGIEFLDKVIQVHRYYFTGGKMPAGAPIDGTPKVGTYYLSPKVKALIAEQGPVLSDRLSGSFAGELPNRSLASPDDLIAIEFVSFADIKDAEFFAVTDNFSKSLDDENYQRIKYSIYTILGMGALGLLVPIMILISTATQLGAKERERRYSALRLVGATNKQISQIAVVDSLLASILGIFTGILTYYLLRPVIWNFSMAGQHFFPEDMTVSVFGYFLIALTMIILVWVTNAFAIRKVYISPLGVMRHTKKRKKLRLISLLPFALGVGLLVYMALVNRDDVRDWLMFWLLTELLLLILGMLFAGGYLTLVYGKMLNKISRSALWTLVSKHIQFEAHSVFRGVSAVVVAFLFASFFTTLLSTVNSDELWELPDQAIDFMPDNTLAISSYAGSGKFASPDLNTVDQETQKLLKQYYKVAPVKGYTLYYEVAEANASEYEGEKKYIRCEDASRIGFAKECKGTTDSAVVFDQNYEDKMEPKVTLLPDVGELKLTEWYLVPKTKTTSLDAERIITSFEKNNDTSMEFSYDRKVSFNDGMDGAVSLLTSGLLFTVVIAIMNLLVATVTGLFERQASFTTLRLTGVELKTLKKIVVRESLIPLVVVSVVSVGLGMALAWVTLKHTSTMLFNVFQLPDYRFLLLVLAMLVVSYISIRLILPMMNRVTSLENSGVQSA